MLKRPTPVGLLRDRAADEADLTDVHDDIAHGVIVDGVFVEDQNTDES